MNELLEQIESPRFSAHVNFASGLRLFFTLMDSFGAFSALSVQAQINEAVSAAIYERIKALAHTESDPDYENPLDAALAAYLRILIYTSPALALPAAKLVSDIPRIWWAEHISRSLRRMSKKVTAELEVLPEPGEALTSIKSARMPDLFTLNSTPVAIAVTVEIPKATHQTGTVAGHQQ